MDYVKDFDGWNAIKKTISEKDIEIFFYEKEIWWASLGLNIGSEQDGKGEYFVRPILILKKINRYTFIAIPLTKTLRIDKVHFPFYFNYSISVALISQLKILDKRRLLKKMGSLHQNTFTKIKKAVTQFLE